jgi:adenylate kinase
VLASKSTGILKCMNTHTHTLIAEWLGSGSINFFGPQFSGKDTQAAILAEKFDGAVIAGGDILRSHKERTDVQQAMESGDLAPTMAYRELVIPYFKRAEYADMPLFLSTVGRMHGEEDAVMEAASSSGHPVKAVVVLIVDEAEVWKRYEIANAQTHDRGPRADDSRDALRVRLEKYHESTEKVIDYYRQRGLVVEIDGNPSREQVTQSILDALASLAQT